MLVQDAKMLLLQYVPTVLVTLFAVNCQPLPLLLSHTTTILNLGSWKGSLSLVFKGMCFLSLSLSPSLLYLCI